MDNAIALVRAYRQLNGYFTVTEFPVVEAFGEGAYRTATDLDVLAFRFPRAAGAPSTRARKGGAPEEQRLPDPELGMPPKTRRLASSSLSKRRGAGRRRVRTASVMRKPRHPLVVRKVHLAAGCEGSDYP